MSSLNVAARQGATPDASAGAERRTTEGRLMPQGRRALFDSRYALFMAQKNRFNVIQTVFNSIKTTVDRFERFQKRSGDHRIQTADQGCKHTAAGEYQLPNLEGIHLVSSTG